ncbi:MAG: YitT family protein [Acidobacteria bacterium]|nr:YitT family protein [Acidobacteriota bacterium]
MTPVARESRNAALIAAGILSAGLGLHGFLLPSNLIDGGVTGISMLLSKVSGWPLAVLIPVVNLPFIFVGYKHLGTSFAVRSAIAIGGLALALAFLHVPLITNDRVLDAVFGGFFVGAGIGLAVRGSAVLDGTEIAALLISRSSAMVKVGDVILAFNVVLFIVAMAVLGVESALYSILTYMSAARTLDFIIHGIEEYIAVTIMSDESDFIRRRITGELGRGVTVYRARGGHSGDEREILYCVVTRLEIGRVKIIVREVDERAFVVIHPLADVQGGTVRKRALH